jgi:ATP synthase protein I
VTSAPPSGAAVRPPWDLSFLRAGALATAAAALVAAPVVGLTSGWPSALGVLVGATVVTGFFCLSGFVIAWAGRIDDALTLPAALGTFLVKALLFFAVLSALPTDGWIDRPALAWAVVVGALLWSVVQARWVWTRQLYYVPPPAPPAPEPEVSSQVPLPDPEKPAPRG